MKKISYFGALPVAATLAIGIAQADAESEPGGDALTIYSTAQPGALAPDFYRNGGRGQGIPGYAVVRQQRDLNLTRGPNNVRFSDVAAFIDPTTVMFESLTDSAGTTVLDQNFQFDLVDQAKLLQKYVDQTIKVDQVRGTAVESFKGTL
ncbi:MAG TPA: hypothetical protein VEW70_14730, partial [Burkholderiales bacterium]|nr:hypothetical protein [Burkholderiales bacterium]